MKRIGVLDTTFARVDMGGFAADELKPNHLKVVVNLPIEVGGRE